MLYLTWTLELIICCWFVHRTSPCRNHFTLWAGLQKWHSTGIVHSLCKYYPFKAINDMLLDSFRLLFRMPSAVAWGACAGALALFAFQPRQIYSKVLFCSSRNLRLLFSVGVSHVTFLCWRISCVHCFTFRQLPVFGKRHLPSSE